MDGGDDGDAASSFAASMDGGDVSLYGLPKKFAERVSLHGPGDMIFMRVSSDDLETIHCKSCLGSEEGFVRRWTIIEVVWEVMLSDFGQHSS